MNANSNTSAKAQASKTISELLNELQILTYSTRQQARERRKEIQGQLESRFAAMESALEHLAKYGKNCDVVFIAKDGLKGGSK